MSDYMLSLNEKLLKDKLAPLDARNGILESYVVSNRKAAALGLKELALIAQDEEAHSRMFEMMRSLFAERGADIEKPNVSELRSVRHTMDLKLRFEDYPYEIRETHDLICEMLLDKVDETAEIHEHTEPLIKAAEQMPQEEWEPSFAPVTPVTPVTPVPLQGTSVSSNESKEVIPPTLTPAAAPGPVLSSTDTEGRLSESPFLASLQAKLLMSQLSPEDARDGIIESFVVAKTKAQASGEVMGSPSPSEGELELLVRGMMREILAEANNSFDDPDLDTLKLANELIKNRLQFGMVPKAFRDEHDERCESIITKANALVEAVTGPKPQLKVVSFIPITGESEKETAESLPVTVIHETGGIESRLEQPRVVPEPVFEKAAHESKLMPTIDELLASLKPLLEEMIRSEVRATLTVDKELASALEFPSGIAARTQGKKIFLAWLDSPEQPSYHVYRREGHGWARMTAAPISRPSFLFEVEADGEYVFSMSAVSPLGVETSLGPQVKVKVDSTKG